MRSFAKFALAGVASLALAGPANAAVITFGALATPGASFSTLTESGFTVSSVIGNIVTSPTAGSLSFSGFGGTIEVVRTGGGTFSASSFDFSGNPGSYLAIGYLGSTQVGFTFGTGGSSVASFSLPTGTFDRLTINASAAPNTNVVASLDNINATLTGTQPAVPEPATWAMMLAGFGLVGLTMRRTKQEVRVKYA